MQLPDLNTIRGRQPVLIDDIISSGVTIARATRHLLEAGFAAPIVVGVHGLHDDRARQTLAEAGITQLICTNSVPIAESRIDLAELLASEILSLSAQS